MLAVADGLIEAWPTATKDFGSLRRFTQNTAILARRPGYEALWTAGVHEVLFRAGHTSERAGLFHDAITYRSLMSSTASELLPADEPDALAFRSHLAECRGEAGDPAAAVDLMRALLEDCERVLGPTHADTLATRHGLIWWTGNAGDPQAAARALTALVQATIDTLGPTHPGTLAARNHLAYWQGGPR